jgi:hypothetical protein
LCRRFGISAETGYKWLGRFAAGEVKGFADRSRRVHVELPVGCRGDGAGDDEEEGRVIARLWTPEEEDRRVEPGEGE